jgi:hypothetical protein
MAEETLVITIASIVAWDSYIHLTGNRRKALWSE